MKTKILILIALVCAVYSFSATIVESANQGFSGTIVFVDPRLHVFIVKGKTEEMTFHAAPGSKFTIDNEPKLLGELQKGDRVTVHYTDQNAQSMAMHVQKTKDRAR
jgi:hypothetical protein